jgi:putative molybdopterin biosynthesis protein
LFERKVYLNLSTIEKALAAFLAIPSPLGRERVPLAQCLGRVLAEPAVAIVSSPAYAGAAMDGVAVWAEDTFGASLNNPKKLPLGQKAFWVNTGHPMPEGTNAVVQVENLIPGPNEVTIEEAVYPFRDVRKIGEDLVATEIVLPVGAEIGPYELGALAAAGVLEPLVFTAPLALFIPSGSEMAPLGSISQKELQTGVKLPEFNSLMIKALVEKLGGHLEVWPIVPDDPKLLTATLRKAALEPFDLIITSAGSSAGAKDFWPGILVESGELFFHGLKAMPGKPAFGGLIDGKPVLGLPGYPVSAVLAFELLGEPLIRSWRNQSPSQRPTVNVKLFQDLPSRPGLVEFIRVRLGLVGSNLVAAPLPRGAGVVSSLARADAMIRIPAESEGLSADHLARAELLRPLEDINGAILAIGSHDNALALLDGLLRQRRSNYSLASAHVGSLGGLLALAKGLTHVAGCHLLGEDGIYNQKAVSERLKGQPTRVIRLVQREQGLMVLKGNPKKIQTLTDLARADVTMVNRQKGSGTRVLFDYELKKLGLNPDQLKGYDDEEFTHLNVAAAVLGGRADVGLGILAAALALNLDFIPIGQEEYDLAILAKFIEDPKIVALLDIIRGPQFIKEAKALGGYGFERTGEEVFATD